MKNAYFLFVLTIYCSMPWHIFQDGKTKAKRQLNFQDQKQVKARCLYDATNLQRAFHSTQNGISVYRASRLYGIPESTLRDRTRGNVKVDARPGGDTLFAEEEEKQLVEHVKYMSSIGYGYTKLNVQYLAADFAVSCDKKCSSDRPLSDNWFYGFLKRWPGLKVAKPQKLSLLRAQYASREVIDAYFKELSTIMTVNNLKDKPERLYNMDETGINTEHAPPKIVCDALCQPQAVTSPRSSLVTIIGGGNAIGNHIPPYYVFAGKRWNDLFLDGAPPGASGEMSDNGWSNSQIFQNYLTKHFAKHAGITNDPNSEKTLVLYDGHRSHISLPLVDWARKHNVILFVLPPHTSHITQPLDVAVFGPFKSMYNRECQLYLQRNPGVKITKYEVAKLSSRPYLKAMSADNLSSAFRKSGIYPFSSHAIGDSIIAPSTIYSQVNEEIQDKENVPELPGPLVSIAGEPTVTAVTTSQSSSAISAVSANQFFQARSVTTVISKPKKRRFVPPLLCGSLTKKKNIDIMESSSKNVKQSLIKPKASFPSSTKIITKAHVEMVTPQTSKSTSSSTDKQPTSPQPGPSSFREDSFNTTDLDSILSEDDSENCCVCDKNSPPALRSCGYLAIVKWAQCDRCDHWTHLSFCSKVKFVRRHAEFLCPHCE